MKKVGDRLDALKTRLLLNWGELAEYLGISRAMLDFLRKGEREPSPKMLRLIFEAERKAGIVSAQEFLQKNGLLQQGSNGANVMESRPSYGADGGNIYEILARIERKVDRILEEKTGEKP